MCNNCKNPSCYGCNYTYQNYPCPQFPPPPGPQGPPGPTGPQGPAAFPFTIVNFATNTNLPQTVYTVDGTEDVILVDSTLAQPLGTGDIQLLPANNPLAANRVLRIKDAFGQSGIHDIRIIPSGVDTIDGVAGPFSIFLTQGIFGSVTLVTNKTNGYNLV